MQFFKKTNLCLILYKHFTAKKFYSLHHFSVLKDAPEHRGSSFFGLSFGGELLIPEVVFIHRLGDQFAASNEDND